MTNQAPVIEKKPRATTGTKTRTAPAEPRVEKLPPFHVMLHNDDQHDMGEVVESLVLVTPTTKVMAAKIMLAAHFRGCAVVLTAHKERAELYRDRLRSRGLVATIEAAG